MFGARVLGWQIIRLGQSLIAYIYSSPLRIRTNEQVEKEKKNHIQIGYKTALCQHLPLTKAIVQICIYESNQSDRMKNEKKKKNFIVMKRNISLNTHVTIG